MNFRTVQPVLSRLDELHYDTLVLSFFADERPLEGVCGLVDWRLNGFLSRMLLQGHLTGEWGEQVLFPQNGRLPFNKLVLFGLGERSKFGSTRFKEVTNRMLRALVKLQCASFATVLPGHQALNLVARQFIDLWLGELQKVFQNNTLAGTEYDIAFMADSQHQNEINEQLSIFTRQLSRG